MESILTRDTNYENEKLNWLMKHAVELLIAVTLMFMVWQANMLLAMNDRLTKTETQVEYINKAVNDVGPDQKSLRELVKDIHTDVEVMKQTSIYRNRGD